MYSSNAAFLLPKIYRVSKKALQKPQIQHDADTILIQQHDLHLCEHRIHIKNF